MSAEVDAAPLRAILIRAFPELADAAFTLHSTGWDCLALDADRRWLFKFPRHGAPEGLAALRREAALLDAIRPHLTLPVPELTLHEQDGVAFSRHRMIPGGHLLAEQYAQLDAAERQRLAETLALFYAELHGLPPEVAAGAGARPIRPWFVPEDMLARLYPVLPQELMRGCETAIRLWQALPRDPYGQTFGFFDGHGWNMAFDHDARRLNGIYDFGDAGIGPLHQEFIHGAWLSMDLVDRTARAYGRLTGKDPDLERIHLLSLMQRIHELAEYAQDSRHFPAMLRNLREWLAQTPLPLPSAASAVRGCA